MDPDPPPAICGRVSFAQLRAAAPFDPAVFRAFWKIMGIICPPGQVYTDPHVVARTQQVLSHRRAGPTIAQPTREQLLTALAGSTWPAGRIRTASAHSVPVNDAGPRRLRRRAAVRQPM